MKESKKWIIASLILAGTVAAVVRFYTVVGAFLTRDRNASWTRLFVPAYGCNDPIKALRK
jgi:hypothetical protein